MPDVAEARLNWTDVPDNSGGTHFIRHRRRTGSDPDNLHGQAARKGIRALQVRPWNVRSSLPIGKVHGIEELPVRYSAAQLQLGVTGEHGLPRGCDLWCCEVWSVLAGNLDAFGINICINYWLWKRPLQESLSNKQLQNLESLP